jgi:hypothetical protein
MRIVLPLEAEGAGSPETISGRQRSIAASGG